MQFKTETKVGIFILVAVGIFSYMTFYLGVFRLNVHSYKSYTIYFDDISGLSRKADVKLAGVKVGWVDDITLLVDSSAKARLKIMILNGYTMHGDAYAEIRQEGLLGSKYLELVPGNPASGELPPNSTFTKEGKATVSIEDLLHKVKNIASNVESVTESLRTALGGELQGEQLKAIVHNMHDATCKIATVSDVLARNEHTMDAILKDMQQLTHDLAPVGNDVRQIAHTLDAEVLPSFQRSVERISDVFDRDFNRVADSLDGAIKHVDSILIKVDRGDGLLGKCINGFFRGCKKRVCPPKNDQITTIKVKDDHAATINVIV